MSDQSRLQIIKENPIGNGRDSFRALFTFICTSRNLTPTVDTLRQLGSQDLRNLSGTLFVSLEQQPAAGLLRSISRSTTLRADLQKLITAVGSDNFAFDRIQPLLEIAISDEIEDAQIWDYISTAAAESTPPPQPLVSSLRETPWRQNTSGFINSSERRHDVDMVLKQELGPLYVDIPNFFNAFFGGMQDLEAVSKSVFSKCIEGDEPIFNGKWTSWPTDAKESDVLAWLTDLVPRLEEFAGGYNSVSTCRRKLLAQPKTPLLGSTGKRSMDIGFVNSNIEYEPDAGNPRYRWSRVLIAGELKSNPNADIPSHAWIDLARYMREVLAAQHNRRFALGFTLCGPLMRVWEFDRLGGIASNQFNINSNEGALQFITTILGFLRMTEETLGFDPTIITVGNQDYINIERNGQTERLIIDEIVRRAQCIAGRATTCWKAHDENKPNIPLVIKDSWQYSDWGEEGELIQEATKKGAVYVARYYHHETIRVGGSNDDIQNNVRRGLDITKAKGYGTGRGYSSDLKQPLSDPNETLPPSTRSCSTSSTRASVKVPLNRIHRRVIVRDYGNPIYEASTRAALLGAFECCIKGHESLYNAGFLHRDISINNLMLNEDSKNLSWPAFLIDLDLATKRERDREGTSGADGKTGTRAFMAIGVLEGEQHSFMHDLESFFWVLFWICVHYNGHGQSVGPTWYDNWNSKHLRALVAEKVTTISSEARFLRIAKENFTPYYKPCIPVLNELRKQVFPNNDSWKREDLGLYSSMIDILREAQKDME